MIGSTIEMEPVAPAVSPFALVPEKISYAVMCRGGYSDLVSTELFEDRFSVARAGEVHAMKKGRLATAFYSLHHIMYCMLYGGVTVV